MLLPGAEGEGALTVAAADGGLMDWWTGGV